MSNSKILQAAERLDRQQAEKAFGKASDFFGSTPFAFDTAAAEPPAKESFVSDKGTVQFQLIGMKPQEPKYSDIMNENGANLLAIGGLVHDYMHRTYPTVNSQKLDINTWSNVIDNIPDLAIGKSVNKEYRNSISGVTISGEFLSMIAKAIITDGASLLGDFSSYLTSVGDVVFSAQVKDESYKALTCTYMNYLVDNGAGGYFDYGAIVLREIEFVENFLELKACCASAQSVKIYMRYTELESVVQTSRIRKGGADYQDFQDMINGNATETFKKAKNFFNVPKTPQGDLKPLK